MGAPGAHHGASRDTAAGSTAFEDYAKAIYSLGGGVSGDPVGTSALAQRLGVSPGAVTLMLKKMEKGGLVSRRPYHGVELTREGERIALGVIRSHRLLESYLTEKLGMPWDRVHDEAEVLEHHISPELTDRIDAALGRPLVDPHGDPIPDERLEIAPAQGVSLAGVEPGDEVVVARVSDSDPEVLRLLAESGIRPGVTLRLLGVDKLADGLRVRVGGDERTIANAVARRMVVTPA
jgi:DtxR family Mn-dependent transcriptional regulator